MMKKAMVMILALAMCLGLVACGSGGSPAESTTPATEPATSTPPASEPADTASAPADTASAPADSASPDAGVSKLEAIKAAGKIVMVTSPDFAPYEFVDPSKKGDEQYVGMDIELGRYIAAELGVELEIKPMDFDATLAAISTGTCDMGISGYSPSEDRMAVMDFTKVYYEGIQVVVIRKEDADKYKTVEDLAGQKVAAQNGSEQQAIVEGQLEGSELKLFTKVPEEIVALKGKQVEAVVLEGPNADAILKVNDDLVVSEIVVEGSTTGTSIAVPKGNEDLVAELDRIIDKAISEDKINEWLTAAMELNSSMLE